jgi:hypothetical protein
LTYGGLNITSNSGAAGSAVGAVTYERLFNDRGGVVSQNLKREVLEFSVREKPSGYAHEDQQSNES